MDEGRKTVFLRIYSGVLRPGDEVQNARTRRNEKVARLFSVHANRRERIERAGAGSIVVAMGLKEAGTGDTVYAPKAPILLGRIEAHEPVIARAIEPKTQAEKERLDFGLAKLADEDPTFRFGEDPETGQTIIRGMGELHLDIMVDRLRREYGVDATVGRPQVVHRETLAGAAEAEARFERQIDDETLFGQARVRVAARPRGSGNVVKLDWPPERFQARRRFPRPRAPSWRPRWKAPPRPCARDRKAIPSRTSRSWSPASSTGPTPRPRPGRRPRWARRCARPRARPARACSSPS